MIPTLRTATAADAQLVADLTRACWVGKPANSSGHFESKEVVEKSLQDGEIIIMELDGKPIGSVRMYPVVQDGYPIALEMGRLGVLPKYRGRGLSTWLTNEVMIRATQRGIEELRLAVRADEPWLVKFYERLGYFVDDSIPYSHANPNSPKPVTMRKYLFTYLPPRGDFV
ncbi:MAG: GNAT family N-acetyltransferase [Deinococcales bacterium]